MMNSLFRLGMFSGCILLFVALNGCGSDNVVPVSGRVTLDNKPLDGVSLTFVPRAESTDGLNVGPGSMGKTDAEGRFTLKTVDGRDGAVIAKHVVRISPAIDPDATPDDPGKASKLVLPKSADNGSLTFVVPEGGTDQADFELKIGG